MTEIVTWYEVVNPARAATTDGGPFADDYSNVRLVVPDGHRQIAHAAPVGGPAPPCLPDDAALVLPSHDLWARFEPRPPQVVACPACTTRHDRGR